MTAYNTRPTLRPDLLNMRQIAHLREAGLEKTRVQTLIYDETKPAWRVLQLQFVRDGIDYLHSAVLDHRGNQYDRWLDYERAKVRVMVCDAINKFRKYA